MASCRWLPSLLLGNSLWRADNCGTPGTWKIDPLVVLLLNSRNSIGLGQGREDGSGCKLFGDRWSSFWLTGWHSALPELFGTPLTPFPSLCSQVQVFCWRLIQLLRLLPKIVLMRLIQLLWLLPKIVLMTPGLPVLRYSAEVALRSCMFPSIVDTSGVSSSVMVAPPDEGSGHWKYFSDSKYAKIEFLFCSVKFFLCLAEAPGLPDPASLTLKFSEPSAWGFFLLHRVIPWQPSYASAWYLLAIPLAAVTLFSNYFLLTFSMFPDRWGSFEIFPTPLSGSRYPFPATVALIIGY